MHSQIIILHVIQILLESTIPLGFITKEGQQYLKKAVECVSRQDTPKKTKKLRGMYSACMHQYICRL